MKKLGGGDYRKPILFTQQDVKHMVIFTSATLDRNWETIQWCQKTMNRPDNSEHSAHIHKHKDKDIAILISKWNLHQKR